MSDPYNVPRGEDPQSLAILGERRFEAMSYSRMVREESEAYKAKRKWGDVAIPPRIEAAIDDYFENKMVSTIALKDGGELDRYNLSRQLAGLWITVGPNLRVTEMGGSVFYNNSLVEKTTTIQADLGAKKWGFGKLPEKEVIEAYAAEFPFSPIRDYLTSLPPASKREEAWETLNQVGTMALGLSDELSIEMVSRTLIGAVARAMRPGCKNQTCLVLQGKQGTMKSTFFEVLFGPEFTITLDGSERTKEWVMTLYESWCAELAELESFTSKKDAGSIKSFISTREDTFRRPYDKFPTKQKRHSVMVATVNGKCPLVDTTGNRRFWMVSVAGLIDLKWVKKNRDAIWAAALLLFQRGEPWWFEGERESISMARAEEFRQIDPWEEVLGDLLDALTGKGDKDVNELTRRFCFEFNPKEEALQTRTILEALGVQLESQTQQHSTRIKGLMEARGWTYKPKNFNGKKVKMWVPPQGN